MKRLLPAVLLAILMAVPARAQQGTTELRGKVTDPQGALLPGVTVTVKNQATGMYRETVSGEEGPSSPAGLCRACMRSPPNSRATRNSPVSDLQLEVGKTATHRPEARSRVARRDRQRVGRIAAGGRHVEGNRRQHHAARRWCSCRASTAISSASSACSPASSPRSAPSRSAATRSACNGQDPRNNNYMLDGGNNNDDVIGQRAGTQARTPIEAIQEFQVVTNQFDAEFGRTAGAIINAVTKQGTNRIRGSAFGYFQRRRSDREGLFRQGERTCQSRTPSTTAGAAPSAARSSRTSFTTSPASSGFQSTGRNTINIPARPGPERHHANPGPGVEHHRPRRSSGQRQQHL